MLKILPSIKRSFILLGYSTFIAISFFSGQKVWSLSANDFNAGNIVSDVVFYNKSTMNTQQIQDFLNRQIPNCDTWGVQPASDFGRSDLTHAQYAATRGWPAPPYVCLNNYHENISTGETSYEKGGGPFSGGTSAAQIIYNAAQSYNINPQVLLVMLKKESAGPLTSDNWPLKSQYRYAMGYGCPDSGPNYSANCTASRAGFYNQMTTAAWQLKYYRDHPNDYRYGIGLNQIQYAPDPACGTKTVNIENMATLSLYIYTPYTPNAGALANYPRTAPCGAYGNRNFFMYFSEWFGSTQKAMDFVPLTTPRWMQVRANNTFKTDLLTLSNAGSALSASRQIRFIDKVQINGKWHLRTEYNYKDNAPYGIAQDKLEEIPYTPITPKWVTFTETGNQSYPASRTSVGDTQVKGTSLKIVDQITVNGNVYYRSEAHNLANKSVGIHSRFLSDFSPISLDNPRNFCANTSTTKTNPISGEMMGSVDRGMYFITKKVLVNGIWYFQSSMDEGTNAFFNGNDLRASCYLPFENPRSLKLVKTVTRINPFTKQTYDTLQSGMIIAMASKIYTNNQWYYRTLENTQTNFDAVIPASAFSEL